MLLALPALAALAACESREVAFCESWLRTGHGPESEFRRLETMVSDRLLEPLAAQRAVYPNYDPDAYFPRRPGRVPVILDVLGSAHVKLRTVRIRYRLEGPETGSEERTESCRFLIVEDTPQQLGEADLYALRTLRAASHTPEEESCCIRTDPSVH
ncbi:MAG: hypothetical protein D6807_00565 [Alphaproteobacteria bacterium]|nr:MAG: hypothetical protein D6807_00565 [Alphaproteobacteria bacterium]